MQSLHFSWFYCIYPSHLDTVRLHCSAMPVQPLYPRLCLCFILLSDPNVLKPEAHSLPDNSPKYFFTPVFHLHCTLSPMQFSFISTLNCLLLFHQFYHLSATFLMLFDFCLVRHYLSETHQCFYKSALTLINQLSFFNSQFWVSYNHVWLLDITTSSNAHKLLTMH
jgi:hypothetical protein